MARSKNLSSPRTSMPTIRKSASGWFSANCLKEIAIALGSTPQGKRI
ncbi:hypothetical protein COO91_02809 [Nostoc flagelliforme CCNUN1]|uniref:Uncharacterized protein n=1 Tax=Nostoc flagelliforme CCNUN1 TaxID=2038116 RepID=A0A2K8SN54_9NOSO|nr:hypothetical protein [Nostoc flagelliforme]AUB36882.1 hypothetical protein COO91_02809 [Nostoc flagelliforme CCNUN1]